jgi:hypothetical protein
LRFKQVKELVAALKMNDKQPFERQKLWAAFELAEPEKVKGRGGKSLVDAIALVRAAQDRGALPYVNIQRARVTRELLKGAAAEQYEVTAEVELARMLKMHAYIAVRGSDNIFETSDVPAERVQTVAKVLKPVLDHRVNKTKWVVLRWLSERQNPSYAGLGGRAAAMLRRTLPDTLARLPRTHDPSGSCKPTARRSEPLPKVAKP